MEKGLMKSLRKSVCALMVAIMVFTLFPSDIGAAPMQQVTVNSMSDLIDKMNNATVDTKISLSDSFTNDLSDMGTVTITRDIALTVDGLRSDATNTKLQAVANKAHLQITSSSSKAITLENIDVVGDTVSAIRSNKTGGFRIAGTNGKFVFENTVFESNFGAILFHGHVETLEIYHSSFYNNYHTNGAGAIRGETGVSNFLLEDSTFKGNMGGGYGYAGGAIWLKGSNNASFKRSVFLDNTSGGTSGGGAVALTANGSIAGDYFFDQCYFEGNKADTFSDVYAQGSAWSDGGAIYTWTVSANQTFVVDRCAFINNSAQDDGGALMMESADNGKEMLVRNSTFYGNHATGKGIAGPPGKSGGAIQVAQKTKAKFENNTMVNNTVGGPGSLVAEQGGAVGEHIDGKTPTLSFVNNIILGNKVLDTSGNEVDTLYDNVYAAIVDEEERNIGLDNGVALDGNMTLQNVFGTPTPTLRKNYDKTTVGNTNMTGDSRDFLPSLPILPKGLADNKGTEKGLTVDQRGFSRNTTPDIGSIESISVKLNANGGQWDNLPTNEYVGSEFYEDSINDLYYLVSYVGGEVTLLDETNLTNNGVSPKGWSTTSSGAVEYQLGEVLTLQEDLELFAVWRNPVYTVTFEANGGSETAPFTDIAPGSTITKPQDPEKEGYVFKGWYKENSFETQWDFDLDQVNSNLTLFAKWDEILTPPSNVAYTVTFEANGGSKVATITDIKPGSTIVKPKDPQKEGYVFKGWYKEDSFETQWDFDLDQVNSNLTLFAKWESVEKPGPTPNPKPDPEPTPSPNPTPTPNPSAKPVPEIQGPETGDMTQISFFVVLFLLGGSGVVFAVRKQQGKNKSL